MAVRPEARRQGIGSALLRALLAWAADNHARHFSLEVRASNAPAIGLYQRLGLRPEGRRPRYYTHPEEDALILGMPVTLIPPTGSFPL
jgi:[ribosomal protein S18]-alanine N-acetyltransferase